MSKQSLLKIYGTATGAQFIKIKLDNHAAICRPLALQNQDTMRKKTSSPTGKGETREEIRGSAVSDLAEQTVALKFGFENAAFCRTPRTTLYR
jgi:hypothetical protein